MSRDVQHKDASVQPQPSFVGEKRYTLDYKVVLLDLPLGYATVLPTKFWYYYIKALYERRMNRKINIFNTKQSCDPVASSPSWKGEKSISVTVSAWAWSRGIVLLFLPQSSKGKTARLEPVKILYTKILFDHPI